MVLSREQFVGAYSYTFLFCGI